MVVVFIVPRVQCWYSQSTAVLAACREKPRQLVERPGQLVLAVKQLVKRPGQLGLCATQLVGWPGQLVLAVTQLGEWPRQLVLHS